MKNYYAKYNKEYSWLIKEEGGVTTLQGIRESQLALGNGFLGSRSVLEEIPYDAKPGTYIAGLYDTVGSQVAELINLPNPFNFKMTVDGEKLGVIAMNTSEHKRTLNLRHGILSRYTIFRDTRNRRYDYQSLRFLSMSEKNIGIMQIAFTALDAEANISIETGIDTSVSNAGTVTEGRKKHFRVKELGQFKNEGFLVTETFNKEYKIIFRSGFYYQTNGKKTYAKDNVFELRLRKNQTIIFTKVFCIDFVSKDSSLEATKKSSEKKFRKAFHSKFTRILNNHIKAWENLWSQAEVSIWGAPEVEKVMRFNIYHMLICARGDNGFSSIGARALTGEGYRGHIFWDTEIFLLPFYLYTLPEVARSMLLYRYKRLGAARIRAKEHGYKGAMFPWESAASGSDQTPDRARDLDGSVIKIFTGQQEHHITADIAYAFYHYYNVTHDEKFLADYGYEIFFETARFWASRVEYNKKKKKYEIKNVIGPNEFHDNVNNNAFTNIMAKWNLIIACKMNDKAKKYHRQALKSLSERIQLSEQEIKEWRRIAAHITLKMDKKQVIEEFDGYFKKKFIKINSWDENNLPIVNKKIRAKDYKKTQFVKQADVLMLLYLLSDVFNYRTKKNNYDFYIERTLHKSSLSLPIYAIMALYTGDRGQAYRFFNTSAHVDIANIHRSTEDGIHAACIGGSWQALINGFAGVQIEKEILSINPRLPSGWRKILCSIHWRDSQIKLEIDDQMVKLRLTAAQNKRIRLKIFGRLYNIKKSTVLTIKKDKAGKKEQSYYL